MRTRRDFIKAGIAATALSAVAAPTKRLATDWVTLGKSNVKVTRLACGTGTNSGRVQRDLGQEGFTRLVRHAYDHGIRFFETSETYRGMAEMLAVVAIVSIWSATGRVLELNPIEVLKSE